MNPPECILLDRDGVINEDRADSVTHISQFKILPGVLQAISLLKQSGYTILVITNQACVGRKEISIEHLGEIHHELSRDAKRAGGQIDDFFVCPHRAEENCDCRKPKPGLITEAREKWGFVPDKTYFVGDALRDLEAAEAASCIPVLVTTGKGAETAKKRPDVERYPDLLSFVHHLISARSDTKHQL